MLTKKATLFTLILGILLLNLNTSSFAAENERLENIESALSEAKTLNSTQANVDPALTDDTYRQKLDTIITVDSEKETPFEFDFETTFIPASSLVDQPGKLSVIESFTEASYEFKAFNKLPIELSLSAGQIDINANDAVPVSLPSRLTEIGFGLQATVPAFNLDKTYFRVKIKPSFYSDSWSFTSNNFKLPTLAFFIYQPNDKLTFILGAGAVPGFEDPFFPVAGFIYKANDKLLFNIVPSRPTISYTLNNLVTLFAEGNLNYGEYKVNKDGYKNASLAYNEVSAGLGICLNLNKYCDLSLSSGYAFNRNLKYRDSLGKVDIKNAIYSEVRLEVAM